MQFRDRQDAGRQLARRLQSELGGNHELILALPRGGVPVGCEVARALHAPLDVMVVRKLGAPQQPEFALGALAPGGVQVLNERVPRWALQSELLEEEVQREQLELNRREALYRQGRAPLDLRGHRVVLVDDGAATGSSMLAAVRAARQLGAAEITVALPVAPADVCDTLAAAADHLVCVYQPDSFGAVGEWYLDFAQVSDAEVHDLLAAAPAGTREGPDESASGEHHPTSTRS